MRRSLLLALCALFTLLALCPLLPARADEPPTEQAQVQALATQVVEALRRKDLRRVARHVHPEQGLRCSPYAFVDLEQDRVLSPREVSNLLRDRRRYTWGAEDGTGDPLTLTGAQYFRRFIYDRDFARAPRTSVNEPLGQGNTRNNGAEVYPEAVVIEYHFPPSAEDAYGWRSLRLVFTRIDDAWYLRGLIHDAPTV
jgi:hypothetical protein